MVSMHPTIVLIIINLLIGLAIYYEVGNPAALWWVVISALAYAFIALSLVPTRKSSK